MPLIMEPVSAFYKGPLLVLDFQSLYPSVMVSKERYPPYITDQIYRWPTIIVILHA